MFLDYRINNEIDLNQSLRDFGFKKDSYTKAMVFRRRITGHNDILYIEAEIIVEVNSKIIKLNFYDNKHNNFNPSIESDEVKEAFKYIEQLKDLNIIYEPKLELNKKEKELEEKLKSQAER